MPTLEWIGKKAVLNHHREVPYRLLRCDPKLSAGDPDCGNPLVHKPGAGQRNSPTSLPARERSG